MVDSGWCRPRGRLPLSTIYYPRISSPRRARPLRHRIGVSGATLVEFAQVNDAAAATTKKLQKYAILAEYFRRLEDDDLRLAVRFAAGRTFAATDERVTAVGGAIVSDVILRLLGVDPQEYYDVVVASGEIGEALSKLWHRRPPVAASREPLALHDLCR